MEKANLGETEIEGKKPKSKTALPGVGERSFANRLPPSREFGELHVGGLGFTKRLASAPIFIPNPQSPIPNHKIIKDS